MSFCQSYAESYLETLKLGQWQILLHAANNYNSEFKSQFLKISPDFNFSKVVLYSDDWKDEAIFTPALLVLCDDLCLGGSGTKVQFPFTNFFHSPSPRPLSLSVLLKIDSSHILFPDHSSPFLHSSQERGTIWGQGL